jgi:hypothetical protein
VLLGWADKTANIGLYSHDGEFTLPGLLVHRLHGVEVDAESLYEAVAIAAASFREDDVSPSSPGPITEFTIASLSHLRKKNRGRPL